MGFSKNDERSVLLIDSDVLRQQLRAAALRNCEIDVHAAGSIAEAERLMRVYAYDLVLFAAQENSIEASVLCAELRRRRPRQRIALLVGAPHYLREVGGNAGSTNRADKPRTARLVIHDSYQRPTHWQLMMEHLLATG